MNISIGARVQEGPWGGGNQFVRALADHLRRAGHSVRFDLDAPDLDLILLAEPRAELRIAAYTGPDIAHYLRFVNPRALVIHRVNECDERKNSTGTNARIIEANRVADHTVYVSRWLHDLYRAQGIGDRPASVILNGSDTALFHPRGHRRWDGAGPLRLVTHHFGAGPHKGFDIYAHLDALLANPAFAARYAFTYIGSLPDDFIFQHATYIEPLSGQALADALRAQHVYLTASRYEPGSNHQNEGALCGLPLLYRQDASMAEYAAGYGIAYAGADDFAAALEAMRADYDRHADRIADYPHTAERAARAYETLFRDLLDRRESLLAARTRARSAARPPWYTDLPERIPAFLDALRVPGEAARYRPALDGLTPVGEQIALGFSCYAHKLYYMLGRWDALPAADQRAWNDYLRGFQRRPSPLAEPFASGAFVDPALIETLRRAEWPRPRPVRWLKWRTRYRARLNPMRRALVAETKQAVATLNQVGDGPRYRYQGFPTTPEAARAYLAALDWTQPWGAGGQAAGLAVFVHQIPPLADAARAFLESTLDSATGAYFTGPPPEYGQLINGAMKVLTALDWLDVPVHHPARLIDTTLARPPSAEGCHLVDAVYVLYRCARFTDHRRDDVRAYCALVRDMIGAHYRPAEGGFSYHVHASQTSYYGATITHGLPVADIHGTILLTWALAMLFELLDDTAIRWKVIRP